MSHYNSASAPCWSGDSTVIDATTGFEKKVQDVTDVFVKKIDDLTGQKEKDVLEV